MLREEAGSEPIMRSVALMRSRACCGKRAMDSAFDAPKTEAQAGRGRLLLRDVSIASVTRSGAIRHTRIPQDQQASYRHLCLSRSLARSGPIGPVRDRQRYFCFSRNSFIVLRTRSALGAFGSKRR